MVGKPFTSRRVLVVLAGLAVGLSSGCGGAVSNKGTENGDAGVSEAMSPPSGGGSGSGSGSCAPGGQGMTNCGAGSESCCTSLEVTGGTFYRTYDDINVLDGGFMLAADGGPTGEADPATVSTFRLDKYLVTVGRFRQFVGAWNGGAGYTPPAGSGKHTYLNGGQGLANSASAGTYETGWDATDWNNTTDIDPTPANLASCSPWSTWTPSPGTNENRPINCVNWWESSAFCIWDGGFLPSEAEWEYAAAGGSQQREYPWGATDPGTENQYAIYDLYYRTSSYADVAYIALVGSATLGAGFWGQLDMAGVYEWNLDSYVSGYVDPCTDCAYLTLTAAPTRVSRGGNFGSYAWNLLTPNRGYYPPSFRNGTLGLRCARAP